MSHVACHMSHCACHMSYVKCLCWSSGHAEQLLFSCLYSKVSICNYVTCHMSNVTCLMSNGYVDPWDMLNNFCFHVYIQKLKVSRWKWQWFLDCSSSSLACECTNHRAASQLNIIFCATLIYLHWSSILWIGCINHQNTITILVRYNWYWITRWST